MTCAALGLLLRVSYELDRAERQVARLRGESPVAAGDRRAPPKTTPAAATMDAQCAGSAYASEPVLARQRSRAPSLAVEKIR